MRRTSVRHGGHRVEDDESCLTASISSLEAPAVPSSRPKPRNQGKRVKVRFVKKSELASSNSELDPSLEDLSICEENDGARDMDQGNTGGSEKKEEEEVADSSKDGDSIQDRLDKLMKDMGELELSEEQLSINDQLQEDEVNSLTLLIMKTELRILHY